MRSRPWPSRCFIAAWVAILLLACCAPARAQLHRATATWDTRYDVVDYGATENRVQGALRLGLFVHLPGDIDLLTRVSTGDDYTSRWSNLYDFNDRDTPNEFRLHVRHLFLQRAWDGGRAQLGVIPPVKNVASSTGIETDGWIDGARVEFYVGDLIIETVGGSVRELDRPNAFARSRRLNFGELELTWQASETLVAEASLEHLGGDEYLRGELRADLGPPSSPRWRVSAEALANLDRGAVAVGLVTGTDVLAWIDEGLADRLEASLLYLYLPEDIGLRGRLTDDFRQFGHSFSAQLEGEIAGGGVLSWFARFIQSEDPRITAGVSVSYDLAAPR